MAGGFRKTLVRLLGGTPARSSLHPKMLERMALTGCTREKASYMVEPGQRVSAYLFVPAAEGRQPAVLCIHQHNREYHLGKSEPTGLSGNPEQFYALELATRGYVALAPDALCFEKRQHSSLRAQDHERFEATKRLSEGSCLQAKMLWDLERALDYLLTRRAYGKAAKDRLRLEVFPIGHGFAAPMREAAYAWFDRWLRPTR